MLTDSQSNLIKTEPNETENLQIKRLEDENAALKNKIMMSSVIIFALSVGVIFILKKKLVLVEWV